VFAFAPTPLYSTIQLSKIGSILLAKHRMEYIILFAKYRKMALSKTDKNGSIINEATSFPLTP
jgi:hypothetical protein